MNWKVDYAHSQIEAIVRHMMISKVHGQFAKFTVNADIDEDHVANSKVNVEIAAARVNTREEKRDAHLRSADFLDAEKYPTITFKSKRGEVIDANHGRMIGDLTIRGVTREVVLDVEHLGKAKSP
jgi:polyisoprenoid-binding protein YceI